MKRTFEIKVRLTGAELESIEKKAKKACLSREGFARAAMLGLTVKEGPSADVHKLYWEVRRTANEFSQARAELHKNGLSSLPALEEASQAMFEAGHAIVTAYTDPRK